MDISVLKEAIVLYVEDEVFVQEAITSILKRRVKKIFTANNGLEGLKTFKEKQNEINLVITDIEMPIMNGIEMIKKIKEIKVNAPIIIITAYNDEAHQSKLADFFILKPVKKEKLFEAMEKSIIKYKNIKG